MGSSFSVLDSQVEIRGKNRRVTKTVIRREQLCLNLKHSLVLKNGNLKRQFICKHFQCSFCTRLHSSLACQRPPLRKIFPSAFFFSPNCHALTGFLVKLMQTEATFLPRALSSNKTVHFIILPAPDGSGSQNVKPEAAFQVPCTTTSLS